MVGHLQILLQAFQAGRLHKDVRHVSADGASSAPVQVWQCKHSRRQDGTRALLLAAAVAQGANHLKRGAKMLTSPCLIRMI